MSSEVPAISRFEQSPVVLDLRLPLGKSHSALKKKAKLTFTNLQYTCRPDDIWLTRVDYHLEKREHSLSGASGDLHANQEHIWTYKLHSR